MKHFAMEYIFRKVEAATLQEWALPSLIDTF